MFMNQQFVMQVKKTMINRLLLNIKHRSNVTLRAWSYQCESIIAQRSRRIQQLFTFYHRVYGGNGLKLLLRSYRRQFQPPLKGLMLSAVGAAGLTFDWNSERIKLTCFEVCRHDIEFIENLHKNEICEKCMAKDMKHCYCAVGSRVLQKHDQYCHTPKYKSSANIAKKDDNKWEPYVSKDDFTIWRRDEGSSLYSYKVYARFNDITARDLLHVQTDIDYRKHWDDTAVTLELIETDSMPGANSHLIYWELRWPKMFANRDYVYCRRYITDENRKVIMVYNRSAKHPNYPEYPEKTRVSEYWSYMVIKPFRNFSEPGIHYVLTYYDDPGLSIPQTIKSWVTQSQMPDFLKKMHVATKQYANSRNLQMKVLQNLNQYALKSDEQITSQQRAKSFEYNQFNQKKWW